MLPRPPRSKSVTAGVLMGMTAFTLLAFASPDEPHLRNIRQLTFGGENAEAYFSHDGKRIIFQSTRDGRSCDQQFVMNVDGSNVRRISTGSGKTTCGYFFAADQKLFFASTHAVDTACPPRPDPSKGYVWRLDPYDIYTANADGSNQHQITNLGGANFAPYYTPDGKRIIFSSNYRNPRSRNFDLYLVNLDGTGLEQVTTHPEFDGFPMFSPDGKRLLWAANRS